MTEETFGGGKYTVRVDEHGNLEALRHGEPWREMAGDKMVLCMLMAAEAERTLLARCFSVFDDVRARLEDDLQLMHPSDPTPILATHRLIAEIERLQADILNNAEEQTGTAP